MLHILCSMSTREPSYRCRLLTGLSLAALILSAGTCLADAVDDYVRKEMQLEHIPGLALAVIKDGKVLKRQGYGISNVELQTPVTADSAFKIGSVSKQFIATAVMQLASGGKLSLDDSITRYLESPPPTWNEITVRHALSHTSGLARESPSFDALKEKPDTEVIRGAYDVPLQFQPGERFQYSNLGYFILAEVVRKVSGQPWPDYIAQNVFAPAHMQSTRTTTVSDVIANRVNGYTHSGNAYHNAITLIALRPSGAFVSTLNDMIKWDTALMTNIPENNRDLMWTPVPLNNGTTAPYGLGWFIERSNGHRLIQHGGGIPGFRAQFSRFMDDRLSVIVLTNNEVANVDAIAFNVAVKYIADLAPQRAEIRIDDPLLRSYTGRYQMYPGRILTVEQSGNRLSMSDNVTELRTSLAAESNTLFFSPDDLRTQVSFLSGANSLRELVLTVDGIEQYRASMIE